MNDLIKSPARLSLIAAIAGAAFLASPLATLAQEREVSGGGPTKGEVPPAKARAGELEAIQARARAAAAKLDFKNPKAVKQANAELATIHADLVAYAKANGLKLTTKQYKHPAGTSAEQKCPEKDGCALSGAELDAQGNLICTYECYVVVKPLPPKSAQ
jgi:hypothetical protein